MTRPFRMHAFAKINLSLRVIGVRPDGYHELRTTFQTLALHDTLMFEPRPGPFEIRCTDPHCPVDRRNLVWRAAELVWRAAHRRGDPTGVRVRLVKRIPMEAGLGGGSSDAAAAIVGFAKLWHVAPGPVRFGRIARQLGADVLFFLAGGTSLGVGRGDSLRRLPDLSASSVVLVFPDFGVSTKEAYAWWDREAESLRSRPSDARQTVPASGNDLQPPVASRHPDISRIVTALERAGASHAAMSGSGSAVFGLFKTRRAAARAGRALEAPSRRVVVTRTLDRESARARRGPFPSRATAHR